MRHFLRHCRSAPPVLRLAGRMTTPTPAALLVPATGTAHRHRLPTRRHGAHRTTVDLPPVTDRADDARRTAAPAVEQPVALSHGSATLPPGLDRGPTRCHTHRRRGFGPLLFEGPGVVVTIQPGPSLSLRSAQATLPIRDPPPPTPPPAAGMMLLKTTLPSAVFVNTPDGDHALLAIQPRLLSAADRPGPGRRTGAPC